jgi:hypothetical protein
VVTNRGATWEYFEDMAYYCDPSSAESIRDAVIYAYHNYDNDAVARACLKDAILSRYNWRAAAERTLESYRAVQPARESDAADSRGAVSSSTPRRHRVSIIIPVYNKAEYTAKCLMAIEDNTPKSLDYEVVIVDNASSDSTPALLGELSGAVTVIRNERNMGFTRACNQGAAAA